MYQNNSTSSLRCLERKLVREYQQERCRIMQLIWKMGLYQGKGKYIPCSEKREKKWRSLFRSRQRRSIFDCQSHHRLCQYFFIEKKDGKKRMVQDYQYLNKWAIKNNYPLPLIVENIRTKKVLMKLDIKWDYTNIRIKERNEWKAAFTSLEGLFEPTVMFFGLINSLAIF